MPIIEEKIDQGVIDLQKGNYFSEDNFFTTDVATGVTKDPSGARIVSLTNDFLLGFWRGLHEECGDAAVEVMYGCGRVWGERYCQRFEQEVLSFYGSALDNMPMSVFNAIFNNCFRIHGWGIIEVDYNLDEKGLLILKVKKPIMASVLKESKRPVEILFSGVMAGYFSHLSKRELGCVQTQCALQGHEESLFILGLKERLAEAESWVTKGEKHQQILEKLVNTRA